MPHSIETLHTRLAHVEERLARLELLDQQVREMELRLRSAERGSQPVARRDATHERLEEGE